MQTDIGVFVFKHLKEHREKVGDSPEQHSQRHDMAQIMGDILTRLSQGLVQDR